MRINKISCIYQIKNNINNKLYIGSTKDYAGRISMHISQLNRNVHGNIYLQRAWNKYGSDSFSCSIVMLCNEDVLLINEQYFIDTYKPSYNLAKVAGSTRGIKFSNATREKMKDYAIAKWNTEEGLLHMKKMNSLRTYSPHTEEFKLKMSKQFKDMKHSCKKVLKVNMHNEIIKEYDSGIEAAIDNNLNAMQVYRLICGRLKPKNNFKFIYK